ncbi:MAG: VOC family protein [Actinomycetota bacterium]|nr:VOC family protein [Actinomycetota bacterium]
MADLVGLHHVALTVTDIERSTGWYRDVLGMEEVFAEQSESRGAVIMRFPGTGPVVALVQHLGADRTGFDPRRTGLDHLAFSVAERADLDAWTTRLCEQGVDCDGPHEIPPGSILNVKDPDGIALSLFWDR